MTRTAAAIRDAQLHPPVIRRGDMIDDLPDGLASLPRDAVACVTTTWAIAYLRREARERFAAQLAKAGQDRTIVGISGEGPGVVPEFADRKPPDVEGIELNLLGAIVYRGRQKHATALAFVHPHGATIDWIA